MVNEVLPKGDQIDVDATKRLRDSGQTILNAYRTADGTLYYGITPRIRPAIDSAGPMGSYPDAPIAAPTPEEPIIDVTPESQIIQDPNYAQYLLEQDIADEERERRAMEEQAAADVGKTGAWVNGKWDPDAPKGHASYTGDNPVKDFLRDIGESFRRVFSGATEAGGEMVAGLPEVGRRARQDAQGVIATARGEPGRTTYTGVDPNVPDEDYLVGKPQPIDQSNRQVISPISSTPSRFAQEDFDNDEEEAPSRASELYKEYEDQAYDEMFGYADGGLVNRLPREAPAPPNAGVADDLPRNLSEGEFVIPKHVVDHFGEQFFQGLLDTVPPPVEMGDQLPI